MSGKVREKSVLRYLIVFVIGGFVIYKVWEFVSKPNADQELLDFLGVIGICFGIVVLFAIVGITVSWLSERPRRSPIHFSPDIEYEVGIERVKPNFDYEEALQKVKIGGLIGLVSLVFGYFLGAAFILEIRDILEAGDFNLGWFLIGLFFTPLALIQGMMGINMVVKGGRSLVQRWKWLRGAGKARATIIDRQAEETYENEVAYRQGAYTLKYAFILSVAEGFDVPGLDGQFVRASVSRRIFKKYAQRHMVDIFFAVDSPEMFVIRGE